MTRFWACLTTLAVISCSAPAPEQNKADTATAPAPGNAAAAANATAGTAGILTAYVGRHPGESVDGVTFRAHPAVRTAVAATLTDPALRRFVLDSPATDAPIVARDGRILAWGCEPHNCGYHNWSISITPDGATADVCFYDDDDSADGPSRWYLAGGTTEERPGNCPSE
ncbi:hypothetical protein RCO27_07535 [Sphingosinicella sp. LHD-64]|uniref:hypothetical protein n=1 Tax=Sphingosinicella sp. LHD-64 TaxID=3072139 RepID=UPI00280E90CF|nr:hypothetical protein [Sphingosinicella sp. LHD-64]MDQ8756080.1 hypothetical protein [Sphingosinicella sp. LHD-64]